MTERLRQLAVLIIVLMAAPATDALAQNTIRLAWDPSSSGDVAGYRVNYVLQSGGTVRSIDVGNVTSAAVNGLELGRWYNFTVSAYSGTGVVSTPSTPVSAFTTAVALTSTASSSTIAPGTAVTWTAVPPAGSPTVEYQFWRYSSGSWTVVRQYSTNPNYTWTPGMSDLGRYALQVWARQVGATVNNEAYAGTGYFDVAPRPFTVTALTASSSSPFLTGQPVQFSAVVNPPDLTSALEYQFWLFNRATGSWSIVRPYGTGHTFTFTPTWDQAGGYAMQVWARYPGSTVNYAGWSGTDFRVDRGIGSLSANKLLPVPPGTSVTWTADAGSSSSTLLYRFYLLSNGAWQVAQDYSTSRSFTWAAGTADLGAHALQVWVKNSTSTAPYDAWRGTGYFDVSRTAPSVVAINLSNTPQAGVATTITGLAMGGYTGPLQYRFWIFSSVTNSWSMLRDYATSSSVTWTPPAAGTYSIQVWVRSAGSTQNYEAWLGTNPIPVP